MMSREAKGRCGRSNDQRKILENVTKHKQVTEEEVLSL